MAALSLPAGDRSHHEQWSALFGKEVGAVAALFQGRRLCPHLVSSLQSAVYQTLLHNLTSLVTVRADEGGFEVRVPGSWELLGVVDPFSIQVDTSGVYLKLQAQEPVRVVTTLLSR